MSHGNYIISDTHFNHKNIVGYENRPFESIEYMNKSLINNWNSVVKKKDTVYHLGDFAFGNKVYIKSILSQLNGKKVLIMGNHDRRIKKNPVFWLECGFDVVYDYPIIYKGDFILSHEPLADIGRFYNIHGHIHSRCNNSNKYINVSVEQTNYRPVNLDSIVSKYRKEK